MDWNLQILNFRFYDFKNIDWKENTRVDSEKEWILLRRDWILKIWNVIIGHKMIPLDDKDLKTLLLSNSSVLFATFEHFCLFIMNISLSKNQMIS